ncbi:MAG: SUMF1/EgtB/PvdO family nonheme iron enzyme [Acidobacteria bacterium]|nr:SUMF1/EgtB/PvdO family nonheme iron enzyme [Acidobacteriota bacterium]
MSRRKIIVLASLLALAAAIVAASILAYQYFDAELAEQEHYDRDETQLIVTDLAGAEMKLFRAGAHLTDAGPVHEFSGQPIWLAKGNYFLETRHANTTVFYPITIQGYRAGTEADDTFAVTIRPIPDASPPTSGSQFVFIPSGHFLFGDRLNPREPHLVWTQGFFIAQYEVTNAEFQNFLAAPDGYGDDQNWTDAGKVWKSRSECNASAKLSAADVEFKRFGQGELPVTQVTWFEAAAYCRWLTRKLGDGRWLYSLPTEAEWEKAARGPDNFDYALAEKLSDAETPFYNWKKNPLAEITVVGASNTAFRPNRYGVYHLGGNVVEWTQGLYKPFNREKPYQADDGRNREDTDGVRVVRGGSWYSASAALMYIPYRDTFQPEVFHHDLGFRIVVRNLMQ